MTGGIPGSRLRNGAGSGGADRRGVRSGGVEPAGTTVAFLVAADEAGGALAGDGTTGVGAQAATATSEPVTAMIIPAGRPAGMIMAVTGSLVAVAACAPTPVVPSPASAPPASSAATRNATVVPAGSTPPDRTPRRSAPPEPAPFRNLLPGMPPVIGHDVYGATRAGMLSPRVDHDPPLLYVPNSTGSSVTVISQRTRRIVRVVRTGALSQHVTPSYDLRHLYTNSSAANALVLIDPHTG